MPETGIGRRYGSWRHVTLYVFGLLLCFTPVTKPQSASFVTPSAPRVAVVHASDAKGATATVTLVWDPPEVFGTIEAYLVQSDDGAGGQFSTFAVAVSETATISGLTLGAQYRFRIAALINGETSQFSDIVTQLAYFVQKITPSATVVSSVARTVTLSGKGFTQSGAWSLQLKDSGGQNVVLTYPVTRVDDFTLTSQVSGPTGTQPFVYGVFLSSAGTQGPYVQSHDPDPAPFVFYASTLSVGSISPVEGPASTIVTVTGTSFVSTSDMQCRFDELKVPAVFVSATQVTCVTPAPKHVSQMHLSFNDIEYFGSGLQFTYAGGVSVQSVNPLRGPMSGAVVVTVAGSGFSDNPSLRCVFATTEVSATFVTTTLIRCQSPPFAVPGPVTVEVSVAGDTKTRNGRVFTYFETPIVSDVAPDFSEPAGGTVVTVTGSAFTNSSDAACSFGGKTVSIVFVSSTLVRCTSPAQSQGLAPFSITFGGGIEYGTRSFIYTSGSTSVLFQVSPGIGPVVGGTRMTIIGSGFGDPTGTTPSTNTTGASNSTRLQLLEEVPKCVANDVLFTAIVVNPHTIICVMPANTVTIPDGQDTLQGTVTVTLDGGKTFLNKISFLYHRVPRITGVDPRSSKSLFAQLDVTIYGDFPIHPSLSTYCLFGEVDDTGAVPVAASKIEASSIVCRLPVHAAGEVPVQVSFNGGADFINDENVKFEYSECPPGKVANSAAGVCRNCPVGTSRASGQVSCRACDGNTYAPSEGLPQCLQCPANTIAVNSTTIEGCVCAPRAYTTLGISGTPCKLCPTGGDCPGGPQPPRALPGFWADPDAVGILYTCSPIEACPGAANNVASSLDCADGYTGRACGKCRLGYYRQAGRCVGCSKNASIYLVGFVILMILIVALVVYKVGKKHSARFMTSIGIVASFAQVLAVVMQFHLSWPRYVSDTVSYATVVFTFNLDFLATECSFSEMQYINKFLLNMSIPFWIAGVLLCIYGLVRVQIHFARKRAADQNDEHSLEDARRKAELHAAIANSTSMIRKQVAKVKGKTWSLLNKPMTSVTAITDQLVTSFLLLLSLAYLFLTAGAVEIFDCSPQPDGKYTLDASPSITCYEGDWWYLLPISIICTIMYGLGIPIVLRSILSTRYSDHHSFLMRYGRLVDRYKREYASWDTHVMIRKAVIAVARLAVSTYVLFQAMTVLLVLFVSLIYHTHAQPYSVHLFNLLESILLWACCLILFGGIAFHAARFPNPAARSALEVGVMIVIVTCVVVVLLVWILSLIQTARVRRAYLRIAKLDKKTPEKKNPILRVMVADVLPVVSEWISDPICGAHNYRCLRECTRQICELQDEQKASERNREIAREKHDKHRRALPFEESTAHLRRIYLSYFGTWFELSSEYYVINWMTGTRTEEDVQRARVLVNIIRSLKVVKERVDSETSVIPYPVRQLGRRVMKLLNKANGVAYDPALEDDPVSKDDDEHGRRVLHVVGAMMGDVARMRLVQALDVPYIESSLGDDYEKKPLHRLLHSLSMVSPVDGGFSSSRGHNHDIEMMEEERAHLLSTLADENIIGQHSINKNASGVRQLLGFDGSHDTLLSVDDNFSDSNDSSAPASPRLDVTMAGPSSPDGHRRARATSSAVAILGASHSPRGPVEVLSGASDDDASVALAAGKAQASLLLKQKASKLALKSVRRATRAQTIDEMTAKHKKEIDALQVIHKDAQERISIEMSRTADEMRATEERIQKLLALIRAKEHKGQVVISQADLQSILPSSNWRREFRRQTTARELAAESVQKAVQAYRKGKSESPNHV